MRTITTKVSDDVNNRLEFLSRAIDRNKSYLFRKAIESFLEEKEDYLIALHRLEQNGTRISLEDLETQCGLENRI
jgi:RHH-type transcriptional regulator, rel operon repressor / antitoxin RelB